MFLHNVEDLTTSRRGREATLACQHSLEKRKEKIEGVRKRGWRGEEKRRMMKNKVNACVAATGQRSISPFLLQGLLNEGKDKGWAKEMLCLSLHWLLIYLCPILAIPAPGIWRLKLQTRQFVQSGFITLDRTTNEPTKMSHFTLTGQPDLLETDTRGQYCSRVHSQTTGNLKQTDITKDRRV